MTMTRKEIKEEKILKKSMEEYPTLAEILSENPHFKESELFELLKNASGDPDSFCMSYDDRISRELFSELLKGREQQKNTNL
jgi:hypothetical protein